MKMRKFLKKKERKNIKKIQTWSMTKRDKEEQIKKRFDGRITGE